MQYDIIIIGGGMVGGSLACALQETTLRIALVDAAPLNTRHDSRLIALNYGSYCLLDNLGIWQALSSHAAPIQQVHISDRGHFGKIRLKAEEAGVHALGYVVPAQDINMALNNALAKQNRVTMFRPAKLKQLTQTETHANLIVETETANLELEGKIIIGADGTHSTVRELLNIETQTTQCEQSAIVTITELQRSHQGIAYERFHSSGAIAMLPLVGDRTATIWTDDNQAIQDLLQLDDSSFLKTLQTQFGYRLGRLKQIGQRHTYPLHMLKSAQTIKQHVVLMGNAAHTLLPLAAQGLNLALSEIAMLVQCITDNPDEPNWQTYLSWQEKQQSNSTRLSHQLPKLFSEDFSLVTIARQIGMIGLDICPAAKKHFAWQAMGKAGQLPRLLLEKVK
ncbi:MAG: FAD-dependent monooxygenase [Gammaproteobacteria bacterium]|nr:FAD-dependent monooxygenase [Gammaproteobacteria bacterium]